MEDDATLDPDLMELVTQLLTRIGMIMEDVGPIALAASPKGLGARVDQVAEAVRTLAALAQAAGMLLRP